MMAPGIGMLGYSIGGLFGGGLLAIIGNREGSMVFGAVSALAFLACGFVHNIYFILAMIFVALFSLGVVYLGKFLSTSRKSIFYLTVLAAPGIIARYFKERVTLANQLSSCGVSVGQFILGPLLSILVVTYSVPGCFIILGGIMMHIVSGEFLSFSSHFHTCSPFTASALYRPTIILSEEEAKKAAAEEAKNSGADAPNPMDFSIFKDITFLMFFISQGNIYVRFSWKYF